MKSPVWLKPNVKILLKKKCDEEEDRCEREMCDTKATGSYGQEKE